MKARRGREPGRPEKTVALFALLGPPLGACLLVITTIPLPADIFDILLAFGLAVALGYRVAFIPMLVSGSVVVLVAHRTANLWLRAGAAIGSAMVLTALSTLQMGRPEDEAGAFLPAFYAVYAGVAALLCLFLSNRRAKTL